MLAYQMQVIIKKGFSTPLRFDRNAHWFGNRSNKIRFLTPLRFDRNDAVSVKKRVREWRICRHSLTQNPKRPCHPTVGRNLIIMYSNAISTFKSELHRIIPNAGWSLFNKCLIMLFVEPQFQAHKKKSCSTMRVSGTGSINKHTMRKPM